MSKINNKILLVAGSGIFLLTAIPICNAGSQYLSEASPQLAAQNSLEQQKQANPLIRQNDKFEAELRALSKSGEEEYVNKILSWLETLPDDQEAIARTILREMHPAIMKLRREIYEKRLQLAAMRFDRKTEPETLPRLGQELQYLRKELRVKLELVNDRLRSEAGITMGPLLGDGLWLQPLSRESTERPVNDKKQDSKREFNLAQHRKN